MQNEENQESVKETVEATEEITTEESNGEATEEVVEETKEEGSKLEVQGEQVDLDSEKGLASEVKDAVSDAKDAREEERGGPTAQVSSAEPSDDKEASALTFKSDGSRHQKNVDKFYKQQEHKKKVAAEKAAKAAGK